MPNHLGPAGHRSRKEKCLVSAVFIFKEIIDLHQHVWSGNVTDVAPFAEHESNCL